MDISSRLIALREARKMSKNQLAQKSGLAQSFISAIEAGKKQPTVDSLSRICRALGITLADFFSQDSQDIPVHLRPLIEAARDLSPEQVEVLVQVARHMKRK